MNVSARDVRPGDEIFNRSAYKQKMHVAFHWVTVKAATPLEDNRVQIETTVFTTVKHALQAVNVRRAE